MSDPIEEAKRSIDDALDLWEAPPVSEDFDRRLCRRIEQQQKAPWWRAAFAWQRQLIPATAAAAILLAAGVWVHRPGVTPASPHSAAVDALPLDQAEKALHEMELIEEFDRLVHSEVAADRKM
jgi:hypothetical protein